MLKEQKNEQLFVHFLQDFSVLKVLVFCYCLWGLCWSFSGPGYQVVFLCCISCLWFGNWCDQHRTQPGFVLSVCERMEIRFPKQYHCSSCYHSSCYSPVRSIAYCKNIFQVSVSCGIPDFRSRDGIYARLAVDFPDLPDPQAMFDIEYFRKDPRPFFKFAKVWFSYWFYLGQ